MTGEEREELLKHLKYNRSIGADYLITDKDADEIIKVLEQELVLDKLRAEIEQTAIDYDKFDDYRRERGLWIALDIIDKYRESEDT